MMQSLGRHSKRFLLFRKTQPVQFSRTLTSAMRNDTFHSHVMAVENRFINFLWRVKVTPVLNDWLRQGNEINPTDLRAIIKALCESQRFDHALQLLHKIQENTARRRSHLSEDREKSLLFKPYPYYKMLSLYGLLGETNLIDEILRQLEENRVVHDKNLTSNNVLKAYASVPDVEAMEKFLKRIEDETTPFALAWQTGISMAGLI
ncbi:hypothetical protein Bca101_067013 [Brassica carinata]